MGDYLNREDSIPRSSVSGCHLCDYVKSKDLKHLIGKNKEAFSTVYGKEKGSILSKAHALVISREHRKNFSELTKEEWKYHLPVIKNVIGKIKSTYNPIGFDVFSSHSKEGGQSHFHSHIHIIPKYKEGYGYYRRKWDSDLTFQEHKEAEDKLQTRQGIIKENSKAVAELVPFDKKLGKCHIIIKPKKPIPNDIEKLDEETWTEMWELMRESIKRCEQNLGAKGFWLHTPLGKATDVNETTRSEFQIDIVPRWVIPGEGKSKPEGEGKTIPEIQRLAEKLRNNTSLAFKNNNLTIPFRDLIKQKRKEKGSPLKIVVDWDEVIQPLKPLLDWQWSDKSLPFDKTYFDNYWRNFKGTEYWNEKMINIGTSDYYEKAGFMTAAKDLLDLLKEGDIIGKMYFVSSYHVGKEGRDTSLRSNPAKVAQFENTFGRFSECSWAPTFFSETIEGAARNSVDCKLFFLRDDHPDFDIFIDDSATLMQVISDFFPSKLCLIPDLIYQKKRLVFGKNVLFYPTECIELKNDDFSKRERERESKTGKDTDWTWLIVSGSVIGGIILFVFLLKLLKKIFSSSRRKKKLKKPNAK